MNSCKALRTHFDTVLTSPRETPIPMGNVSTSSPAFAALGKTVRSNPFGNGNSMPASVP